MVRHLPENTPHSWLGVQVGGCSQGVPVSGPAVLYVEEWGFGEGPNFRPDMVTRNPDLVNGAFREYGVKWGIPRVAKLFDELDVPLSIPLSARFPENFPQVWQRASSRTRRSWSTGEQLERSAAAGPRHRGAENLYPQDPRRDRAGIGGAAAVRRACWRRSRPTTSCG